MHTLDLLDREGSVAQAAKKLRKAHSAVIKSIQTMESRLNLQLVDRSGYRTSLTDVGRQVLNKGRLLLAQEAELYQLTRDFRAGIEPILEIVYDGFIDSSPLIDAAHQVRKSYQRTDLRLYQQYLGGVTEQFSALNAAAMITLVGDLRSFPKQYKLKPIRSFLVARANHELCRHKNDSRNLERFAFLTVRDRDDRLALPTVTVQNHSVLQVPDFYAKKAAILRGYGYGWLPEYLIKNELNKGLIKHVRWNNVSEHQIQPTLVLNPEKDKGPALRAFVDLFLEACSL